MRTGPLGRILALLILLAVRAVRARRFGGAVGIRLFDVVGGGGGPTPLPLANRPVGLPLAVLDPFFAARIAGVVVADLLFGKRQGLAIIGRRHLLDVGAVRALAPLSVDAKLQSDETTEDARVLTECDMACTFFIFFAIDVLLRRFI